MVRSAQLEFDPALKAFLAADFDAGEAEGRLGAAAVAGVVWLSPSWTQARDFQCSSAPKGSLSLRHILPVEVARKEP